MPVTNGVYAGKSPEEIATLMRANPSATRLGFYGAQGQANQAAATGAPAINAGAATTGPTGGAAGGGVVGGGIAAPPPTGDNNVGLINSTFEQVLGRNPSAEVIAFYQNQLANGLSPEEFQAQVAASPEASQRNTVPQIGVLGAESALQGGLQGSIDSLMQALTQSRQEVGGLSTHALDYLNRTHGGAQEQLAEGVAGYDPYRQQGTGANQLQAALSGALGPQAQAEAFKNYQESPGQQFYRDEIEKGTLRNASATGGLGGGNVLKALQDRAFQLAQTDYGNQFDRLGTLSDRGLTATAGAGSLLGLGAGLAGQQAASGSNIIRGTGQDLADLNMGTGRNIAELLTGTASQVATGRTNAGVQVANAIGGTTSALSDLQATEGAGAADLTGQAGNLLSSLLVGAGEGLSGDQLQLAQLLANLSVGEGSQLSGAALGRGGEAEGGRGGWIEAFLGGG